jgi:WD40 repeat protein
LWKSSADLAGHTAPITTARFSQTIFASNKNKTVPAHKKGATSNSSTSTTGNGGGSHAAKEVMKCGVVALGGCDGLISIWKTDTPRPIVVLKQAFTDSITDMCWSSDGYSLLITSRDAAMMCLTFTKEEVCLSLFV